MQSGQGRIPFKYRRLEENRDELDGRTRAERDRDRVLYSWAFRRLAGVTQVVTPGEGEVFHNRLTHSLKVAQVARRLAEQLRKQPVAARAQGIDPDVVEAAALAHDLGHPPFGHIAEHELQALLLNRGVQDSFEGNAQAFRIITKLAIRDGNVVGLNLTRATLNAVLKYPWFRDPFHKKKSRKWGAYHTESAAFEFSRERTSGEVQSIEAQIMDWADEIAYAVHDVEDFFRAGLIPLHALAAPPAETNPEVVLFLQRAEENGVGDDATFADFRSVALRLFQWGEFPREPYRRTRRDRARLWAFRAAFIRRAWNATRLSQQKSPTLQIDPGFRLQVKVLKQLNWQYAVTNPALAGQQYGQRRIVRDLFEILERAAFTANRDKWLIFPTPEREALESLMSDYGGNPPDELRYRIVADAVAGMTDRQAHLYHQRLTGTSAGSVGDPIVG
jgi:dGTPase